MKMNKKLLSLTALTAVFAGGFVGTAHAQVDVDVNADFLEALVLSKVNDIDYGKIEQSATIAGGDTATMNTDSSIAYAGNFSGPTSGQAGVVDITAGTDGNVVDVFCDSTAVLFGGGGTSNITMNSIAIDVETPTASPGSVGACVDQSTAAGNLTLTVGSNDTILLGGILDGGTAAGPFVPGPHSTTNAGGDPITVDVQYQ